MEDLKKYFQNEYSDDKKRIDRIDELVQRVVGTIAECDKTYGVPYEICTKSTDDKRFSSSTSSMILFVLLKLKNEINFNSPIIPNIKWNVDEILKDSLPKTIDEKIINILELLYMNVEGIKAKKATEITHSGSFGVNDPFTLSWLFEILLSKSTYTTKAKFLSIIIEPAKNRVRSALEKLDRPILEFSKTDGKDNSFKASTHIFPLIKLIHVFKSIQNSEYKWPSGETILSSIKTLRHNLFERINQQLSYSMVSPNLFDTSELVMSLEGILLLEDELDGVNNDLVKKIFEVVTTHQVNNLYWRPLMPFVTTPQGLALLPLSIEIANSLLRICKHLQVKGKFYYFNYFKIFEKYFEWLDSELVQVSIGDKKYSGWHSENILEPEVIHPWETAQVIIFLMNYKSLLENQITFRTFTKSGLADKKIKWSDGKLKEFLEREPLKGVVDSDNLIFRNIIESFIISRNKKLLVEFEDKKLFKDNPERSYSMLLFGPPGTGKSTIPEEIARALKWNLVTITPSDFLQTGESDIESNAKDIFKVLEEQENCVILLDEIDRLLLDRDSEEYRSQDDVFKFMTPSMLVKLKDLRVKEKSIFIIATNFAELIDPAIKRTGRIDEKYLVCPPNKVQRFNIVNELVNKRLKILNRETHNAILLSEKAIEPVINATVFFTFGELKLFVKNCDIAIEDNQEAIEIKLKAGKIEPPTINLASYRKRFNLVNGEPKSLSQYPILEFFMLIYVRCEVESEFDDEEKSAISKVKETIEMVGPFDNVLSKFIQNQEIYKHIHERCQKEKVFR